MIKLKAEIEQLINQRFAVFREMHAEIITFLEALERSIDDLQHRLLINESLIEASTKQIQDRHDAYLFDRAQIIDEVAEIKNKVDNALSRLYSLEGPATVFDQMAAKKRLIETYQRRLAFLKQKQAEGDTSTQLFFEIEAAENEIERLQEELSN